MKLIFRLIAFCNAVVLLNGCATIANGRYQQVTVATQPPGANCVLSNNKGQWAADGTPATVKIHRSMDALHVSCQKPGYAAATDVVKSGVKKMVAGNVVFGGLIGSSIDTVNGSAFSYPNRIDVTMSKSNKVKATA